MKKSIIDRIFPPPSETILPQYESHRPWNNVQNVQPGSPVTHTADSDPRSSRRAIAGASRSPNLSTSHYDKSLSASLLQYDDPFLPLDRATKALQDTIQSLLDVQSAALDGRTNVAAEDSWSNHSLTPTPSTASSLRAKSYRTIPIRQPPQRKTTLRGARKGLRRCMQEFSSLRQEELQMLQQESKTRTDALQRIDDFGDRRNVLNKQIESIQAEGQSTTVSTFRSEAVAVQNEIEDLEHRLLELRVRHRHLLSQADQVESSLDAKTSSYKNALLLIDKEARDFLKRPPIQSPLGNSPVAGLYTLQPQRRTLEMAREQWSTERDMLTQRTTDVEAEYHAFLEAEKIWSDALIRIDHFETRLRASTRSLSQSISQTTADLQEDLMQGLLRELDGLIGFLQNEYDRADESNWNLLLCALGAEMHACREARKLLQPVSGGQNAAQDISAESMLVDTAEDPVTARQSPQKSAHSPTRSVESNQSLKDTLAEFRSSPLAVASIEEQRITKSSGPRSESEDDEPPADFLLSR